MFFTHHHDMFIHLLSAGLYRMTVDVNCGSKPQVLEWISLYFSPICWSYRIISSAQADALGPLLKRLIIPRCRVGFPSFPFFLSISIYFHLPVPYCFFYVSLPDRDPPSEYYHRHPVTFKWVNQLVYWNTLAAPYIIAASSFPFIIYPSPLPLKKWYALIFSCRRFFKDLIQ